MGPSLLSLDHQEQNTQSKVMKKQQMLLKIESNLYETVAESRQITSRERGFCSFEEDAEKAVKKAEKVAKKPEQLLKRTEKEAQKATKLAEKQAKKNTIAAQIAAPEEAKKAAVKAQKTEML